MLVAPCVKSTYHTHPSASIIDEQEVIHYVSKPGAKSDIWNFFGLRSDAEGKVIDDETAFCKICNRAIVARNGNTSNLRLHLKTIIKKSVANWANRESK